MADGAFDLRPDEARLLLNVALMATGKNFFKSATKILAALEGFRSGEESVGTAKVILKDHLEHCISEDGADAEEQLRALNDAIDKFMQ